MDKENEQVSYGFWIWKHKLKAVLIMLCLIAKCDLEDHAEENIHLGLSGSNDEENQWFTYSFIGESMLKCRLAIDSNDPEIIHIQIDFDKGLEEKIHLIDLIQATFDKFE